MCNVCARSVSAGARCDVYTHWGSCRRAKRSGTACPATACTDALSPERKKQSRKQRKMRPRSSTPATATGPPRQAPKSACTCMPSAQSSQKCCGAILDELSFRLARPLLACRTKQGWKRVPWIGRGTRLMWLPARSVQRCIESGKHFPGAPRPSRSLVMIPARTLLYGFKCTTLGCLDHTENSNCRTLSGCITQ